MEANRERVDEFKAEVAGMRLRPPDDSRERVWLIGGLVLPLLGLGLILFAYWGASGTAFVSEQIPFLISGGVLGLALVIVGAALFVRYSMTRYLRFWLIRMIYEDRSQTDRVVRCLEGIETALRSGRQAGD